VSLVALWAQETENATTPWKALVINAMAGAFLFSEGEITK
jgi:hypothetical protein